MFCVTDLDYLFEQIRERGCIGGLVHSYSYTALEPCYASCKCGHCKVSMAEDVNRIYPPVQQDMQKLAEQFAERREQRRKEVHERRINGKHLKGAFCEIAFNPYTGNFSSVSSVARYQRDEDRKARWLAAAKDKELHLKAEQDEDHRQIMKDRRILSSVCGESIHMIG